MGLSDMFSLKAVDRGKWLDGWPASRPRRGSVSDLFIRLRAGGGPLASVDIRRLCECFLVEEGGDGRRVFGRRAEGSLAWDFDGPITVEVFLLRAGTGRLLNVLLRGIPPIGSSGRQM
jgi:hypothetical protein